jgi:prepilin-type N-terminal cleavage/methylation domain-containing protein
MRKRGFTIIEIIVAVVLIALMSLGMTGIFIAAKRHVQHSRSRVSGGELGKVFLEPLQMQVRQDQWASNCLGAHSCNPLTVTIDNIGYTGTYSVTDNVVADRLRRVTVNVTWSEPST